MEGELFVKSFALALGQIDSLLLFPVGKLDLESGVHAARIDTVDSVEKRSHDSECFRDQASNLTRVIPSETNLNLEVDHGNSSK